MTEIAGEAPQQLTQGPDVTRRGLLKHAGAAGLLLTSSGLIAACGASAPRAKSGTSTSNALDGNPATPRQGGTLSIGILGNGSSETYNPALANTNIDILHCFSVFDSFSRYGAFGRLIPGLALEWQPNAEATVWEIRLRPDVVWHDGKRFTADDVLYTLRLMGNPASLGHESVVNVRLNDIRKRGDYIVQVPLHKPNARLFELFVVNSGWIVQDGFKNFSKPIGTGPFKLVSFTPGQRSTLAANRDYWDHPRPYLDTLEIISIDDDGARLEALESGQIDVASPISAVQARASQANTSGAWKVVVSEPGVTHVIVMRVDVAPFNDNRVRMAMKLIADRQALIEAAFSGYGVVGNDIVGRGLTYYDTSLPQRQQDIEQAKSLLRAAGVPDLRLTIQTANVSSGVIEAATAFAQQATAAGVTINVKQDTAAAYFNPQLLYLKMPFAQDIWTSLTGLQLFYNAALVQGAPYNETHWNVPSFNNLVSQAESATDPATAQRLWSEVQTIQYNQGGYVVWAEQRFTDGISKRVAGYGGPGTGWTGYPDDARVYDWGLAG
ncbi:MAG TPA: ABC transporter substrate-binding protein [Solirubrobacteraceae bacterium]|jgi:peptide/nickel transport system substrate-binding protein|nr:ABC transporter substrate-binding protein [Solirubrobacteraceae bacterium]